MAQFDYIPRSVPESTMPRLLIVGGGLFGSQAAAYARHHGIEAIVFDAGLTGAASPAAAGLFKQAWAGRKVRDHFDRALPILDQLFGLRQVYLRNGDGAQEAFHFVPPSAILEKQPIRATVTAVGDGWLEANGERYEGNVYIAAGIWSERFHPGLGVYGKAGASFLFAGERDGRIRQVAHGRQAIAFVRDAGTTFFSDGTAERQYDTDHDQQTLNRAAALGLTDLPIQRMWGWRPYAPGGPVFLRLSERTWLATGGRKMGTILGASFARRLVEELIEV
jgi:glycine/D-amino acid oxidase-like deaminating enzyme